MKIGTTNSAYLVSTAVPYAQGSNLNLDLKARCTRLRFCDGIAT